MGRLVKIGAVLLVPLGLAALELSFRFPQVTESLYARRVYPGVVALFGAANRGGFSWAEVLLAAGVVGAAVGIARRFRRHERGGRRWTMVRALWIAAGLVLWVFLVLWGFNYARPSLESRLELSLESSAPEVLLDAARRVAAETSRSFRELGVAGGPTKLPLSLEELDAIVDEGYRELRLPGDAIGSRTTPAKALASSTLFSFLGISGIFVPFTGEPLVNALQPDAALPMVLAHEKAHQRGITNEGEANFAAFLLCARDEAPPYLRYAAYLFAAQHLLGEASLHFPREELYPAWDLLEEGPRADVRAIRDFWRRYEGRASDVASHVNDGYLRALGVEDGVRSYGTVVRMLLALDRRGELVPES